MTDTQTGDQPVADDQGNPAPVLPTDEMSMAQVERSVDELTVALDAAETRVGELEAKVTDLEAYIGELEADPYRAPGDTSGQLGDRTPALDAYEAQQLVAEQQAWDRDVKPLVDAGLAVVEEA